MSKRGPKPVDIGALDYWEFAWWKAFNFLRYGSEFPPKQEQIVEDIVRRDAQSELEWMKKGTASAFLGNEWEERVSQWKRAGSSRAGFSRLQEVAASEREFLIRQIEARLKPEQANLREKSTRRAVWDSLWRARTTQAVRAACKKWQSLLESPSRYPNHVLEFESEFRRMKREPRAEYKRFPRSRYADDSRINYLSRGMAGLMVHPNRSPMTVIHRLRTMSHTEGGPLWNGILKQCDCWRCIERRIMESIEKDLRERKGLFLRIEDFPETELPKGENE